LFQTPLEELNPDIVTIPLRDVGEEIVVTEGSETVEYS
jgi:hypothetical protein